MKVLIVSGFLGAGKTTLIKEMANKTKRDFVVMENEYGDVDIDSTLLKDEGMNIWELTEGCVCCSMKKDFASSILTISNSLDPEYLIVEPTGVAKLSNIINNIKQIEYEKIVLLKPITIIDGNAFDTFIKNYNDIYVDQLLNSSRIIISKMENKDNIEREELIKKIEKIFNDNNVSFLNVEIIEDHYTHKEKEWWESILKSYLDDKYEAIFRESDSDDMPESISMKGCDIENEYVFMMLLEQLVRGRFGSIARSKGFIKCRDNILKYDVVGGNYAITGCENTQNEEGEIVFIGKNINRKLLREIFQPVYRDNIKN